MDRRIDEIEPVEGGFLMVHLKPGYCLNDTGCHTFGADNQREVYSTMKRVKLCGCSECFAERLYKENILSCPACKGPTKLDGILLICDKCKRVIGGKLPEILWCE